MGDGPNYNPEKFFETALRLSGSALIRAFWPAVVVTCATPVWLGILALEWEMPFSNGYTLVGEDLYPTLDLYMEPWYLMVALLLSARLTDAHEKHMRASGVAKQLQIKTMELVSKLCVLSTPGKEARSAVALQEARRLIVLTCVLMKQHVRKESSGFDRLISSGVMTLEEERDFNKKCTRSCTDGKLDRFPSTNRPALTFHKLRCLTRRMAIDGLLSHWDAVDARIDSLAEVFDVIEDIQSNILPFHYAQLTRLMTLFFLITMSCAVARDLSWTSIPACFTLNLLILAGDTCAGDMETPFGDSDNDVQLHKTVRRVDKWTAAMLGSHLGTLVENFDLYSETRTTNVQHGQTARALAKSSSVMYATARDLTASDEEVTSAAYMRAANTIQNAVRFRLKWRRCNEILMAIKSA